MNTFDAIEQEMQLHPRKWLVTGCAGLIGSNSTEHLFRHDQPVAGLDNLSTAHFPDLEDFRELVSPGQWRGSSFIDGDACDRAACRYALSGVDKVLHQAALGSVPCAFDDPIARNDADMNGFLNLVSADAGVQSFVHAASSPPYNDHPGLPRLEPQIGRPLSPDAVTNNVSEHQVGIDGDRHTSRDVCCIDNVRQANMLAAHSASGPLFRIYNVALGAIMTLTQLFGYLKELSTVNRIEVRQQPIHMAFRGADSVCSHATGDKASRERGCAPRYRIREGLAANVPWYVEHLGAAAGTHQQAGASAERYATAE